MDKYFGNSLLLISFLIFNSFSVTYEIGPDKNHTRIDEVTDLLVPGDTVLVDGDHTYEGGIVFTETGSIDKPILIKGLKINNKKPIISGGVNCVHFSSPWPYTSGADHYIFEGFEVTGGSSRGIFHQAGNLTIKDVVVHDCPAHGILGADQGAGSCTLKSVEVYNCGEGSGRHQIYMATDEVNRPGSVFRMEYCYIHNANGGNNIKSRAERNEIYYNWIESAFYHELELIGPDPGGAADEWNPKLKREDSDIVGNVLWKNGSNKDFSVVRFGGDATGESHGRYRFVNNTVICGTGSVFRCFDSLESIEMYNNLFYPNDNNTINLMRTVEANWTSGEALIAGSNNWVYEDAINIPSQWTGTIEGVDPGFEDFNNFKINPISGSVIINGGNNEISGIENYEFPNPLEAPEFHPPQRMYTELYDERITDEIIDIGAFEYDANNSISGKNKYDNKLQFLNLEFSKRALIFELKETSNISFAVYNASGKKIINMPLMKYNRGVHRILFNEMGINNRSIANGIYLLKMKKDSFVTNLRLILN